MIAETAKTVAAEANDGTATAPTPAERTTARKPNDCARAELTAKR